MRRTATSEIAFWKMATTTVSELKVRAESIVAESGVGKVCELESIPGAGSAPGATIASVGVVIAGDHLEKLRGHQVPIVARVKDSKTYFDLRTVRKQDDHLLVDALRNISG